MDTSGSQLHFWVKDDGRGITPSQIEKIFEPFYTTHEKGTGLGLAIVHKIVENHNGEIRVNSPPNGMAQGCCFSIIIPINASSKTGERYKWGRPNKAQRKVK